MQALNGYGKPDWVGPWDPIQVRRAETVLNALLTQNGTSARKMWDRGGGGDGVDHDPRRSLEDECGWPTAPGPELYSRLYNSDSIASRVISFPPGECWRQNPSVYEVEEEDTETAFETDIDELGVAMRGEANWFKPQDSKGGHPLYTAFANIDVLSRVGQYGFLWYGFNDGLDPRLPVKGLEEFGSKPITFKKGEKEPEKLYVENKVNVDERWRLVVNAEKKPGFDKSKPSTKGMELLFARGYTEAQARVTQWENNKNSSRYLQPLMYQVTALDPNGNYGYGGSGFPLSTEMVHWTRGVHIADTHHHAVSSAVLALPALQPVLYDVLDGRKISGADGEAFFRNAILKVFFETHPQLGGDVLVNDDELQDMMERMSNGSQQWARLSGMSANPIAPSIADPNPHLDAKYKRIAISMGKPKRVFEGSERGELSSAQDEKSNNDTVLERCNNHCTPSIITPGINRLILVGVLTEPVEYFVEWPQIGAEDPAVQATIFSTKMTGYAAYISGSVGQVMSPKQMWIESGKTSEEADAILEEAEKLALEAEEEAAAQAEALGMEEVAPGEFVDPAQKEKDDEIALEAAKAGGGKPGFGGPPNKNGPPKPGGPPAPGKKPNPFARNFDPDQERDDSGKWAAGGGGSDGSHGVQLPKGKGRLTIDQADSALKEMGYSRSSMGDGRIHTVTGKDGSTKDMSSKELRNLVYSGQRAVKAEESTPVIKHVDTQAIVEKAQATASGEIQSKLQDKLASIKAESAARKAAIDAKYAARKAKLTGNEEESEWLVYDAE